MECRQHVPRDLRQVAEVFVQGLLHRGVGGWRLGKPTGFQRRAGDRESHRAEGRCCGEESCRHCTWARPQSAARGTAHMGWRSVSCLHQGSLPVAPASRGREHMRRQAEVISWRPPRPDARRGDMALCLWLRRLPPPRVLEGQGWVVPRRHTAPQGLILPYPSRQLTLYVGYHPSTHLRVPRRLRDFGDGGGLLTRSQTPVPTGCSGGHCAMFRAFTT